MDTKFNLILDSTCDLPREVWDVPGVSMLHFTYTNENEAYVDDMFESRTPKDFYDWMRAGAMPSTSQPTQGEFEDAFRIAAASGVPTVYLAFGHALSGCYEGACVALERIKEEAGGDVAVYVVDTMLPCSPQGLLVAEALRLRARGMSAEELISWVEEARYFINVLFMVDSLEPLARGGRIPSGVAGVGDMLDVKPMLSIDLEGALTFSGVARGRKKGLKRLAEYFEKNRSHDGESQYVVMGNADCLRDSDKLSQLVRGIDSDAIIIEHNIGPTIGSHVGPGMISCAFWGQDRREKLSISDRIANRVKTG